MPDLMGASLRNVPTKVDTHQVSVRQVFPVDLGGTRSWLWEVALGLLLKRGYLGPKLTPGLLFILGKLDQGIEIADACKVPVGFPMVELLADLGAGHGLCGSKLAYSQGQSGPEPVECLVSELGPPRRFGQWSAL